MGYSSIVFVTYTLQAGSSYGDAFGIYISKSKLTENHVMLNDSLDADVPADMTWQTQSGGVRINFTETFTPATNQDLAMVFGVPDN